MTDDLITRQSVINEVSRFRGYLDDDMIFRLQTAIKRLPTVDAVPVRHGKWIKLDMHAHLADHKCTACGQECYVPTCMGEPMYIYCPNCGARMEEDET